MTWSQGPPRPSLSFPGAGGKGSVWPKSASCRRPRGWDSAPRVQVQEPRGGPGQPPRAWSWRGQRRDRPAPEARCRRCPASSPHQPSAVPYSTVTLPCPRQSAVLTPPGLATLPPSRTCRFPPRAASTSCPGHMCFWGHWAHVPAPVQLAAATFSPPGHSQPGQPPTGRLGRTELLSHARHDPWCPQSPRGSLGAASAGPDVTVPSRKRRLGVCPQVSPCRGLSTHHVSTRPRAPSHSRLAVPGGDSQAAASPSGLSDIPEHRTSAHETYSLEGALNYLTTRRWGLTGPKTPPHSGPENTSPAACVINTCRQQASVPRTRDEPCSPAQPDARARTRPGGAALAITEKRAAPCGPPASPPSRQEQGPRWGRRSERVLWSPEFGIRLCTSRHSPANPGPPAEARLQ